MWHLSIYTIKWNGHIMQGVNPCQHCFLLGLRQAVRHQILTLLLAGSNPAVPARNIYKRSDSYDYRRRFCILNTHSALKAEYAALV